MVAGAKRGADGSPTTGARRASSCDAQGRRCCSRSRTRSSRTTSSAAPSATASRRLVQRPDVEVPRAERGLEVLVHALAAVRGRRSTWAARRRSAAPCRYASPSATTPTAPSPWIRAGIELVTADGAAATPLSGAALAAALARGRRATACGASCSRARPIAAEDDRDRLPRLSAAVPTARRASRSRTSRRARPTASSRPCSERPRGRRSATDVALPCPRSRASSWSRAGARRAAARRAAGPRRPRRPSAVLGEQRHLREARLVPRRAARSGSPRRLRASSRARRRGRRRRRRRGRRRGAPPPSPGRAASTAS